MLILICTSGAFAQTLLDFEKYEDTYTPDIPLITAASSGAICSGPRKDIYELTTLEQNELKDLIMAYLTSELNPNFNPATQHPSLKYTVVAEHSAYGNSNASVVWHSNNEVFFSWHRDYIQGLEQYLLDQGHPEFVPLPGWNPNKSIPAAFEDAVVSEVLSTPFFGRSMALGQISDGQLSMYEFDDQISCAQFSGMNDFAGGIRAGVGLSATSHNAVHGTIGGAMGIVQTASAAAIFWLFHAHVDDLYHCYQTTCENCAPAFIRATHFADDCDYCFDFSLNENVDNLDIVLIDDQGVETVLPWGGNRSCIRNLYLESDSEYTVRLTGSPSPNQPCSDEDVVEIPFTSPVQPPKTKWRDPCNEIIAAPQFPIPDGFGEKRFMITNEGSARSFTFVHTHLMSSTNYTIAQNVALSTGQQYELTVPSTYVLSGYNVLSILVDGEVSEVDYLVSP